eukprot:7914601-Alexandrium_andersonii.AAC.1
MQIQELIVNKGEPGAALNPPHGRGCRHCRGCHCHSSPYCEKLPIAVSSRFLLVLGRPLARAGTARSWA